MKRILVVPPLKKCRAGAEFISNGGQEYVIEFKQPFWQIYPYKGGRLVKELRGNFTSYDDAKRRLVAHLSKRDKLGYARWPGKESRYGPFNG